VTVHVNLELTDHCNISCGMCSQSLRDEAHGAPMRFMDWPTWRDALLGLEGMGDVHLCPHWLGEPTIHPHFDRFVEYAFAVNRDNRLFREFKLHTNGVVLSEARARLLLRLARSPGMAPDTFRFVHFSIDAWDRQVYERVKGADRRDQVYRNVERFLHLRAEQGAVRPHVVLAFVVQPGNLHDARAFRDHWVGLLGGLGREVDQVWDWPHREADAVYLRPLNCAEQVEADRLHADVCRDLGFTDRADGRLRAAESF